MKRDAKVTRKTKETDITVQLNLDGRGKASVETGIGFFNHMLETLALHSFIDLEVKAVGDLKVDDHHTIEDVGIAFGETLLQALGEKKRINRFGWALCPMDEALARAAVDISGRPYFILDCSDSSSRFLGNLPGKSIAEFFRGFTVGAKATLHLDLLRGQNRHHAVEALFKAFGKALNQAVMVRFLDETVPSTKGVL